MKTPRFTGIFIVSVVGVFMVSCPFPEPVTLHGYLTGVVTDAETSDPIQAVTVRLDQSYVPKDSTSTGSDGRYLFKNLVPDDDYMIRASISSHITDEKYVTISEAETELIDFHLLPFPIPILSDTYIDFGFDITRLSFTISYTGNIALTYDLTPSQEWITVFPKGGYITNEEVDTITITIDRTGLPDSTYKETITVSSIYELESRDYKLNVYLNGAYCDGYYYKAVTIGTQTWMAENLNRGKKVPHDLESTDNGDVEKYCYNDDHNNCDEYGGLYSWPEAMRYDDTGPAQGICPDGWHIPDSTEWTTLADYCDWDAGKLKEAGPAHWAWNEESTNETGFTALPGGQKKGNIFEFIGNAFFWSATGTAKPLPETTGSVVNMEIWGQTIYIINTNSENGVLPWALSVRCIKDP